MIETLIFFGAGFLFWSTTIVIDRWPRITVCEELANLRRKYRLSLPYRLQALPPLMDEGLVGRLYNRVRAWS